MGTRYKLCMMGVDLNGPSMIFGDNTSVITNSQNPDSTLNKTSNLICYHTVSESVTMGESVISHIRSDEDWANLLAKILYEEKRMGLVRQTLMNIYNPLPQ